jgi:hypothetical protein
MKTRHSRGISRAAAEQLLDGRATVEFSLDDRADLGTDKLARVLAAASAPAREGELTGEQMAMAAFEANRLAPIATSVTPKKEHTSMLTKIFTAKVLLSSLAAFATGGVALAAGTGALSSPSAVHVSASASASTTPTSTAPGNAASVAPTTAPSQQVSHRPAVSPVSALAPTNAPTGAPSSAAAPTTQPTASATATSLPQTAAGLCTALADDVDSATGLSPADLVQALSKTSVLQTLSNDSSEFSSLISTAGSAADVSDYCALLLDLPQLPDPSQLADLPGTLLGQLLTALPVATLTTDLTSLPSSTLSQVLTAVPASALTTIVTELPSSVVSQLLAEVPSSVLSQLLSELPSSVVSQLSSIIGQL